MINIFEVFLPQLLRYPNPTDPLNGEAAALLMRDPKGYDLKVKGRHDLPLVPAPLTLTQSMLPSTRIRMPRTKQAKTRMKMRR